MAFTCQSNFHLSERDVWDMFFLKRRWLLVVGLVVLLCVALGTFLVWRANQPVELKTVYALPEPNPERAEILKRALQPPKRAYAAKASNKEATTGNATAESLEADSGESSSQENDFEEGNLESMLAELDKETVERNSDFPPVPEGFPLPPVWTTIPGYEKGDMPDHELIYRVLIKLWNQGDRGFQDGMLDINNGRVYPMYPDVLYVEWHDTVFEDELGNSRIVRYIASSAGTHKRGFELEDFITGEWKSKYPDTKFVTYEDAGYDPHTFLTDDD